jgi:hypothetical protein
MGKELEKDEDSLKEEETGEAEAGGAFNDYVVRVPPRRVNKIRYLMSTRESFVMVPAKSIACRHVPQPVHLALALAWPLSTWSLASSRHSLLTILMVVPTLPPSENALED